MVPANINEYEIKLRNMCTGHITPLIKVYGDTNLFQLLSECRLIIWIYPYGKNGFINSRTGQSTQDKNMTVEKFGVLSGDILDVFEDVQ